MGWWSRAVSAVKSAVNKAVTTVKKVAEVIKKTVSKTVKKVSSSVNKVKDTIKKKVSKTVKKVSSSVNKVKTTVKNNVAKVVDVVKDKVDDVKETIKDKASESIDNVKEKVEDVKEIISEKIEIILIKTSERIKSLEWWERVKAFFKERGFFTTEDEWKKIEADTIQRLGKLPEETTWDKINMTFLDFAFSLNAISRLFTGKNLKGEPEEFKPVADSFDLVFLLIPFMTVGKAGKVVTKLGSKGFIRLFATKTDDAVKIFSKLNVDDQARMLRGLFKTDEGVKIINKLLHFKALKVTLVKPTMFAVDKKIAEKLVGKLITRLPTWIKAVIGVGTVGLMFVAFQWTDFIFGLRKNKILDPYPADLLSDATFKSVAIMTSLESIKWSCDAETYNLTLKDIEEVNGIWDIALDYAETHPESDEQWKNSMDNLGAYLGIGGYTTTESMVTAITNGKKLFNDQVLIEKAAIASKCPEFLEIEIPETVKAIVRDIIDGDTIDLGLDAKDAATGREIKLPEYRETGHARVRIVGINAPEKSPKGEILCSDVEIFNVEKKFADESRDRLVPLNDKEVTLLIDPEISVDTYNRILAVVEHEGVDIGLRQIIEGLACGYYREPHKYYDEGEYSAATLEAKDGGIGMWKGLEEVEKEEEKIKIIITSEPTNARLFLDDVALHHNTPSDEIELSDVLHLFTLGKHILSVEKGGLSAMQDIEIIKGDNGAIHLTLETEPFPEVLTEEEIEEEELEEELVEEEIEEEEIEEEIIPEVEEPEELVKIPTVYTSEQAWALKEAFEKILILTEGTAIMSAKERDALIAGFTMYSDEQKQVLNLLWKDLTFYTQGRNQLSADEYIELKEKYRMI